MDSINLIQMSSNWLLTLGCSAASLSILLIVSVILFICRGGSTGDALQKDRVNGKRRAYVLSCLALLTAYSVLNTVFVSMQSLQSAGLRMFLDLLAVIPLLSVLLLYKTVESYEQPKVLTLFTVIQIAVIVLVPALRSLPDQAALFVNIFLMLWFITVTGYGFYLYSKHVHRSGSGNTLLLFMMLALVVLILAFVNDFSLSTIDFVILPDYIQVAGLTAAGAFLAILLLMETPGFADKAAVTAPNARLEELKTLAATLRSLYNFGVEISGNTENSAERLLSLVRNSIGRTTESIDRIHSVDGQIKVNISELKNSLNGFIADISPVLEDRLKTDKSAKSIEDIANILEEIENKGKIVSSGVVNLTSIIDNAKKNTDKSRKIIMEIRTDLENIDSFSQTIDKVSEEANTLAMNAAIESAGSGGAGKGFRVVSEDLRGLSSKIKSQTEEIKNVMTSLKRDLEAGISSTENVRAFFLEIELITENIFRLILDIVSHAGVISGTIAETRSNIDSLRQVSEHLEKLFLDNRALTDDLNREIEITRNNFYHIAGLIGKGKEILDSLMERSQGLKGNTGELFRLRESVAQALRDLPKTEGPPNPV